MSEPERSMTFRIPESVAARLKEEWQNTFPKHGCSFNRWMVALLSGALEANSSRPRSSRT